MPWVGSWVDGSRIAPTYRPRADMVKESSGITVPRCPSSPAGATGSGPGDRWARVVGEEPGAARSGPGRHNGCHDHRSASRDASSPGPPVMIPLTGSQYPIGAGAYSAV